MRVRATRQRDPTDDDRAGWSRRRPGRRFSSVAIPGRRGERRIGSKTRPQRGMSRARACTKESDRAKKAFGWVAEGAAAWAPRPANSLHPGCRGEPVKVHFRIAERAVDAFGARPIAIEVGK